MFDPTVTDPSTFAAAAVTGSTFQIDGGQQGVGC
jgi:hypothetical protein